jgi:hypothetical protein
MQPQEGDADGPFIIGALVKERVGTTQGELIWYTSGDMLTKETDAMVSGANMDLFCQSVAFLVGNDIGISIRSKAIMPERLQITASAGNLIAICLIGVIPAVYMIPGILIAIQRRRRK